MSHAGVVVAVLRVRQDRAYLPGVSHGRRAGEREALLRVWRWGPHLPRLSSGRVRHHLLQVRMTGLPYYSIPLALNDTPHVLHADVNLKLLTQEVAGSLSRHSCSFV